VEQLRTRIPTDACRKARVFPPALLAAGMLGMIAAAGWYWLANPLTNSSEENSDPSPTAARLTSREYQHECQRMRGARNWQRLEATAREWSEVEPERLEPWLMAADAAREQGAFERVVKYLQSVPSDAPRDVLVILADLQLHELFRPTEAETTLRTIVDRFPQDVESRLRLIQYYAMTCEREKLIEQTLQCMTADSPPLEVFAHHFAARWLLLSNGYEVNQQWLNSVEQSGIRDSQPGEVFAVAAVVHLFSHPDLKLMAEASGEQGLVPTEYYEAQVDRLLQRYPENHELFATKLKLRSYAGDVPTVAELLAKVPPATAEDPRFWYFAGWLYAAVDKLPQAIESLEKGLRIDPLDWLAWNELAQVTRRLHGAESAKTLQNRANQGKQLYEAIRSAPHMSALGLETYRELAKYMDACGEETLADRLQTALARVPMRR
jgi:hypothetical protein